MLTQWINAMKKLIKKSVLSIMLSLVFCSSMAAAEAYVEDLVIRKVTLMNGLMGGSDNITIFISVDKNVALENAGCTASNSFFGDDVIWLRYTYDSVIDASGLTTSNMGFFKMVWTQLNMAFALNKKVSLWLADNGSGECDVRGLVAIGGDV